MAELLPRVVDLARQAKALDLGNPASKLARARGKLAVAVARSCGKVIAPGTINAPCTRAAATFADLCVPGVANSPEAGAPPGRAGAPLPGAAADGKELPPPTPGNGAFSPVSPFVWSAVARSSPVASCAPTRCRPS